ncbi:uncharacterized protein LOC143478227 [Brachyhypopomus gauderio]|uniref:uncharacterized protein LOC143478227 n=1 Tax=Brachyhypopomus gauderio TaxID=698409 RepID=UPI0040417431
MLASILGFIYAVGQVLMPCLPPVPLSTEVLTTDQYLGKWYYVGVASWDKEDIEVFKEVDNSVVNLKMSAKDILTMVVALGEGDECNIKAWDYKIYPNLDPIMEEGDNYGVIWDGMWINCSSCLILGKYHPSDAFIRFLLFARTEEVSDEVVENFKEKIGCFSVFNEFLIAPRTKEFCKLEDTD